MTFESANSGSSLTGLKVGEKLRLVSMATQATTVLGHGEGENLPQPALVSLVESARTEFQTCLQLLAERARFLTGSEGVGIALIRDQELSYSAAVGESVPEPGTAVETNNEAIRKCMEEQQAVFSACHGDRTKFALTAPVMNSGKVIGFFRLESGREFDEHDVEAVTRLADLTSVAAERHELIDKAEELLRESGGVVDVEVPQVPETKQDSERSRPSQAPGDIHGCAACGFPVSAGRALCVECDQKPGASTHRDLFVAAEPQESWISTNGYTIATVLVTALTAIIIFWLRR